MAAAHAADRGEGIDDDCDTYYAGYETAWPPTPPAAAEGGGSSRGAQTAAAAGQGGKAAGCSNQSGVLRFQHRCQKGSSILLHARAPAVAGFVSSDELAVLIRGAVAAAAASSAQPGSTPSGSPAAAPGLPLRHQASAASQQQVAVLLQCRLHLCLQTIAPQRTSAHHSSHNHKHSYHAQHSQRPAGQGSQHHAKPNSNSSSQPSGPSSSIELLADDVTYFGVTGLGGKPGTAAKCVCIQGLQLYTAGAGKGISTSSGAGGSGASGSSRICALLVPKHSKTTGPPGLELLQVVTGSSNSLRQGPHSGSTSSSSSSRPPSARQGSRPWKQVMYAPSIETAAAAAAGRADVVCQDVMSVLLRGATLSMDPGGLSLDWANHLTDFFGPLAAAAAAAAAAAPATQPAASTAAPASAGSGLSLQQHSQHVQQGAQKQPHDPQGQQQQQVLVLNLQDFAVRCEPRADALASHNSSRMAAALVLDGAHWRINPGPSAPQHLLLHSLGFYVAAAAARSLLTPGASSGGHSGAGSSRSKAGRGLGVWDPAVPVDLHGFSLSAAGYHCIAQEGGLGVIVRPAAAAAGQGQAGIL